VIQSHGSEGWEDEIRNSAAKPVRNLMEVAAITEQDDLLEIGCGIGRIGLEVAPRCRSWTGADVSANMLGERQSEPKVPGLGLQSSGHVQHNPPGTSASPHIIAATNA
jgi:cyclopropane fatty-acyl-phospholipid synthase-like methyltransferase